MQQEVARILALVKELDESQARNRRTTQLALENVTEMAAYIRKLERENVELRENVRRLERHIRDAARPPIVR